MWRAIIQTSRSEPAKVPRWSMLSAAEKTPCRLIAPKVGLSAYAPQKLAGRIGRAARMGADGGRDRGRADRRGGTARRAARGAGGVVRVPRPGRVAAAEGDGDRLAEDRRPALPESEHRGGVLLRAVPGEQRRAVLGRHVDGIDQVLDADREPVDGGQRGARPGSGRWRRPRSCARRRDRAGPRPRSRPRAPRWPRCSARETRAAYRSRRGRQPRGRGRSSADASWDRNLPSLFFRTLTGSRTGAAATGSDSRGKEPARGARGRRDQVPGLAPTCRYRESVSRSQALPPGNPGQ